jgi:hypothetical protein
MAIFFAAPFLLAAGFVFTILSVIPRARRWGIPISSRILALVPCWFGAALAEELLMGSSDRRIVQAETYLFQHARWAFFHGPDILAVVLVLLGGIIAALTAQLVASGLPKILLRLAIFVAAWYSYFVVFRAIDVAENAFASHGKIDWRINSLIVGFGAMLGFIAAFFIAKRSEDFRPRRLQLPWGTTFRRRGQAGIEEPAPTPAPDAP